MKYTFIAYIDEAGDDGVAGRFREPGKQGGSSHWLSIGAVIWRASRDLDAVQWAKEIISQLPMHRRNKILHFSKLDHNQRVMAINTLIGKPFRTIVVLANKPAIPVGAYVEKNQLYFSLCRYLIERISWLCRDFRPVAPEGDGRVKIVFARRGGMSYPEFRASLNTLRQSVEGRTRIHWPVVDVDGLEAYDQIERFGLQIADLVTSGINVAIEPDFYGNNETRFARLLKPHVYSRSGIYLNYGAKLVPADGRLEEAKHVAEFVQLFEER